MPTPKKNLTDYKKVKVNYEEAANFLNLSKSAFFRLIDTGVIPKSEDGVYVLGEVVESYWRNQFDSEGLKAAQTRLVTAQAEIKETELATQRGELHRASSIAKIWTENVLNAKMRLLSIPTKLPPVLVGQDVQTIRQKLENEIKEALKELADYDGEKISSATTI